MSKKRELKRANNKYGKYLDPLMVTGFLFIVALAVSTVISLNTDFKAPINFISAPESQTQNDVLGINVGTNSPYVEIVPGEHRVIKDGSLYYNKETNDYDIPVIVERRLAGPYSKPLVVIRNTEQSDMQVEFKPSLSFESKSEYGVFYEGTNYILSAKSGEFYNHEFTLAPGESKELYIYINSENNVNYSEEITFPFEINVESN